MYMTNSFAVALNRWNESVVFPKRKVGAGRAMAYPFEHLGISWRPDEDDPNLYVRIVCGETTWQCVKTLYPW